MSKILLISHYGKSITNLRGDLIKEWIQDGHEVVALGPEEEFKDEVQALGVKYRIYPLEKTGYNLIKDLQTLKSLRQIIREERPEVVFTYAVKPNIYGSLMARIEKVPNIYSMINGAGYIFSDNQVSLPHKIISFMVKKLYKMAVKRNKAIFFQNPEDQEAFQREKILSKNTKSVRIYGSGVNMERFSPRTKESENINFLLISRLLWDKGIGEYVEAAQSLKKKYPKASFQLLGPFHANPKMIQKSQVDEWTKTGVIEYLGETNDVRDFLKESSVFLLPTYYREGVPRSILEAMSMEKPIITTMMPGCRETVVEGKNGFLIPPRDAKALEEAMEYFLKHPETIQAMGRESRNLTQEKFDVRKINDKIIDTMNKLNKSK